MSPRGRLSINAKLALESDSLAVFRQQSTVESCDLESNFSFFSFKIRKYTHIRCL